MTRNLFVVLAIAMALAGCKIDVASIKVAERVCANATEEWGGSSWICSQAVFGMDREQISVNSITRCRFANLPAFCGIMRGREDRPVAIWIFNTSVLDSTPRAGFFTKLLLTKEEAAKAAIERVE